MSFTFGQQFLSVDRAGMINTEQIHFSCPLDDFEVTSVCTLRHSEPLETSTMSCLLVGKKKVWTERKSFEAPSQKCWHIHHETEQISTPLVTGAARFHIIKLQRHARGTNFWQTNFSLKFISLHR